MAVDPTFTGGSPNSDDWDYNPNYVNPQQVTDPSELLPYTGTTNAVDPFAALLQQFQQVNNQTPSTANDDPRFARAPVLAAQSDTASSSSSSAPQTNAQAALDLYRSGKIDSKTYNDMAISGKSLEHLYELSGNERWMWNPTTQSAYVGIPDRNGWYEYDPKTGSITPQAGIAHTKLTGWDKAIIGTAIGVATGGIGGAVTGALEGTIGATAGGIVGGAASGAVTSAATTAVTDPHANIGDIATSAGYGALVGGVASGAGPATSSATNGMVNAGVNPTVAGTISGAATGAATSAATEGIKSAVTGQDFDPFSILTGAVGGAASGAVSGSGVTGDLSSAIQGLDTGMSTEAANSLAAGLVRAGTGLTTETALDLIKNGKVDINWIQQAVNTGQAAVKVYYTPTPVPPSDLPGVIEGDVTEPPTLLTHSEFDDQQGGDTSDYEYRQYVEGYNNKYSGDIPSITTEDTNGNATSSNTFAGPGATAPNQEDAWLIAHPSTPLTISPGEGPAGVEPPSRTGGHWETNEDGTESTWVEDVAPSDLPGVIPGDVTEPPTGMINTGPMLTRSEYVDENTTDDGQRPSIFEYDNYVKNFTSHETHSAPQGILGATSGTPAGEATSTGGTAGNTTPTQGEPGGGGIINTVPGQDTGQPGQPETDIFDPFAVLVGTVTTGGGTELGTATGIGNGDGAGTTEGQPDGGGIPTGEGTAPITGAGTGEGTPSGVTDGGGTTPGGTDIDGTAPGTGGEGTTPSGTPNGGSIPGGGTLPETTPGGAGGTTGTPEGTTPGSSPIEDYPPSDLPGVIPGDVTEPPPVVTEPPPDDEEPVVDEDPPSTTPPGGIVIPPIIFPPSVPTTPPATQPPITPVKTISSGLIGAGNLSIRKRTDEDVAGRYDPFNHLQTYVQ